ncbi:MAG: restriction endonuclease subunit S [Saprospiraceae bacterium]|nr:restriction endonuclease subunit S [Candidatus Vicinibacter affinis]
MEFPKAEQLTIANYLDDQTQKIDRLIANKKAQAEKLKELRQIEINNAVTKGLNPNAEMKHSGIVWLGKIPKHWEVRKIKQLLKPEKNAIKTGPFGSDLKFEDLIEEGIKVYNQRSVLDNDWESGEGYISEKKYETLKTCTIFPDDMVITTRGTIGKVSIFPLNAELGILHPCLMRIQMNSQRILNDYLKIIINDSSFFFEALKLASNATTIDVIYSESLKEVKIPVPPVQEQIEITSYLKERIASTDKLSYNIQTQIEKLQELRKIKIYEAVTGKIKVNAYVEKTA